MRLNDPEAHINFLRMDRNQFEELLRTVGPKLLKSDKFRDDSISPSQRLCVTLRYLASGDSMISIHYQFRIGRSTVQNVIKETCQVIWSTLNPKYLMNVEDVNQKNWKNLSDSFQEKWNFPNCIGAIDGKHIILEAPPHSGSTYFNYKGQHSIILMAICDANYCFTIVDVGSNGRQSDGGVFKNSLMGKKFGNNEMNVPEPAPVGNGPILPYVLVGDEAFQLTDYMMRPFPGRGTLDRGKNIYNYRLSRARRVIENSFGILSSKWRIFSKPISASVDTIENITLACVCLHNFLRKSESENSNSEKHYCPPDFVNNEDRDGNFVPGTWRRAGHMLPSVASAGSNTHSRNASYVREQFKHYFNNEGAVTWQWDRVDNRMYF